MRRRDFTFDDAGQQTAETWIASNGSTVDNRLTFTYDAVGQQLSTRDLDGAYTLKASGDAMTALQEALPKCKISSGPARQTGGM